ncbi:MAG: hypothetical protein DI630_16840 [Gordonia sp. (in: high G+C Gram-positive bacteria)]|nr:MAG: hypothetical protein DI630_16840 [Gordonia sp. (in: high G+C Gram-positive bacteria)]
MTDYVLLATYFDQAVERDEKGLPTKVVKHYQGAVISDLDEANAERLLRCGAVAEVEEATGEDPEQPEPQNPPSGDVDSFGLERPKKAGTAKAWEDYAVALFEKSEGAAGLNREDAEKATKQELIELFS